MSYARWHDQEDYLEAVVHPSMNTTPNTTADMDKNEAPAATAADATTQEIPVGWGMVSPSVRLEDDAGETLPLKRRRDSRAADAAAGDDHRPERLRASRLRRGKPAFLRTTANGVLRESTRDAVAVVRIRRSRSFERTKKPSGSVARRGPD